MAFRIVFLENEHTMRIKLDNLVIERLEGDVWIPLSDISMLVVDNMATTLTTRMLCALAENNIGLVICDAKHHPIGFYSSYDTHSRISKHIGAQITGSSEFYDGLWKQIVCSKLENQAQVLEMYDKEPEYIERIRMLKDDIQDGDETNREAVGAKLYFEGLMGKGFSRNDDNELMNSGLDYGYAIVRAYLARLCVGYGLNTQLGIHHRNEYNRFNLVDDLMEPFRPILDMYVYILLYAEEYFRVEHRHLLVNFLNHYIKYKGKKMHICNAMEEYVAQVAAIIQNRRERLVFPEVCNYLGESDEI